MAPVAISMANEPATVTTQHLPQEEESEEASADFTESDKTILGDEVGPEKEIAVKPNKARTRQVAAPKSSKKRVRVRPKKGRKGGITGVTQQRINSVQKITLEAAFRLDSNWLPAKIDEMAQLVDLKRAKVYKWFYDRRIKFLKE